MTTDSPVEGHHASDRSPGTQEWVYESIIRSVPGLNTSRRVAIAVQFVGFELGVLGLSWYHGLPVAAVAGTVGVLVAVAGSVFMLRLSGLVRNGDTAPSYRRLLFGSRIELVLGLIAFLLLIVYVFVYDPRQPGVPLVVSVLGDRPPILFSLLLLMLGWDVTYRIGVGWWASVAGLWRTIRHPPESNRSTTAYTRIDTLTIAFAAVQLAIVPVLGGHPLIQAALIGHVLAVAVVSGFSVLRLRNRHGGRR